MASTSDLVDLHTHLLPALDDGPGDLGETIATLRAAHAGGARRLAATPHMFLEPWNHRDPATIRSAHAATLLALRDQAARDPTCAFLRDLRIDLGAENFVSPAFFTALDRGEVLTLNGGRYLLVEFPLMISGTLIVEVARRILDANRFPVIAHVERYAALFTRDADLARLRELGCVLQVNAQSLAGRVKDATRRRCVELLRAGLVQVVASDVHGPSIARPHLGAALRALEGELPAEVLEMCFHGRARRILDDAFFATNE
jgi:protein-tyrosine phosphatase